MKQQNKLDAVLARVKGNKRAQRIAAALACLVVFVTLWRLTLPAITLEWGKPQAEGITEPEMEETLQEEELLTEETLAEEPEEEAPLLRWATLKEAAEAGYPDAVRVDRLICGQTESEGHRHSADCIESYYAPQSASFAEEAFLAMPAQRFEGEAGNLAVRVDAEEGTFPEATEMALTETDTAEVRRAASGLVNGRISQVLAVDIGFLYEGEKIEPEQPVQVVLSGSALEGLQNPVVLHIDGEGNAEIVSHRTAEEAAPAPRLRMAARSVQPEETLTETTDETAEHTEETLSEEAPEETIAEEPLTAAEELPKGALVFEAKDFSVYAVVTTIETTYITADGETYGIKVTYGEDAGIPEGAALEVRELSEEEYTDYRVKTAETLGCQENAIGYMKLLDISIVKDGEPIQPQAKVDVEIRLLDKTQSEDKEETSRVVHFGGEAEELACAEETIEEMPAVTFQTDAFSVYAMTYTVDFHYEVDGKTYEFTLPGGGFLSFKELMTALEIAKDDPETEENELDAFLADVTDVAFSNPELVSVSKIEEDTTVGAIKEALSLACEYSAELTEEDIANINATAVEAGDWALISLKPFDTEESLTVTMANGEVFTVKVTDAQTVTDSATFKEDERFVIAYVDDEGKINVLTSDGNYEQLDNQEDIDYLDSRYLWRFYYVFTEKDETAPNANYEYYFIRPLEDLSKSIALIDVHDTELIQNGTNNIAVVPIGDGTYFMEGYSSTGADMPYLYFDGTEFKPDSTHSTPLTIFTLDDIKKYQFTVRTADPTMGLVYGKDKDGVQQDAVESFVTRTKDSHNNNWGAEAKAIVESAGGQHRYLFDYFDLNGEVVPAEMVEITNEGRNAKIKSNLLQIPYNGSILTAHFKQNPDYVGASKVESLQDWVNEIRNTNVPLDEAATKKTAEVYDYENRIYRVDLTTRSSLNSFTGTIDLGLILDVSGSMKFPSKLEPAKKANDANTEIGTKNIRTINDASVTHTQYGNWNGTYWSDNWFQGCTQTRTVVDSYNWQDWGMSPNQEYYVIAEKSTRATVYRIFYEGNHSDSSENGWYRIDASYGNNDYNGNTRRAEKIGSSTKFSTDSDFNYPIYVSTDNNADGTAVTRSYYEKKSIDDTAETLNTVLGILNIAEDTSESPDVRAAWNTFAWQVKDSEHSFVDLKNSGSLTIDYATEGGTRTDKALSDALDFNWGDSNTKYAILITDGAPQFGGTGTDKDPYNLAGHSLQENTDELIRRINEIIPQYEQQGIKLITVGLSMKDVPQGNQLLYNIADTINGKRMFFEAESGDELENALLEVVKTILLPCNVYGDVTDEVGEGFYLVDRETGKPLQPGDTINLEGVLTNDLSQPYGEVQPDGKTVKWIDQTFKPDGWQGTVYVKAKEDFLGGNMLPTNTGNATFEAKEYTTRTNPNHRVTITKNTEQIVNPEKFHPVQERGTPLVNVNELSFTQNETEWTVYLGTEVDPKTQLEELWHEILVEEVVKEGCADDKDNDGLPEIGKNQSGNLWYPKAENSINDDRESEGSGDKQTFKMNDLIKVLAEGKGYTWWDYAKNEPKWDEFFTQALSTGGITIPYKVYGLDDDSKIAITLTKKIATGEEADLVNGSPHDTTVTGDKVEEYTLKVVYTPDYTVLPRGQGGNNTADIHTGTYGTLYQGHAAGTETSENKHVINVYAEPLDVLKKDDHDRELQGAEFKLYRTAKEGESVDSQASDYGLPSGSYYCISTATSGNDGIAHLAPDDITTPTHTIPVADGQTAQNLLVPGETYYLVESSAPTGYQKDGTVRTVTVVTGEELFTGLDGETITVSPPAARPSVAYNWEEGVTIVVKTLGSDTNEAEVVNHTTRQPVTLSGGRTYMLRSDKDQLAVTQVTILNGVITDIEIQKTDLNGNPLASAVLQLKAVSENGKEESDVTDVTGIGEVKKTIDGRETTFTSAFETTAVAQKLTGLPDGTYRLYEVVVPAGYISTFQYIQFTIGDRAITNVTVKPDNAVSKVVTTAASGANLAKIQIKNEPGTSLPSTGGPGTRAFTLAGLALTLLALAGITEKRKRG